MKPFLICLIAILTLSCSTENESDTSSYVVLLPVESVGMPQYFEQGETYQINLTYLSPTNCHYFNDIYYDVEGNSSHVAVLNTVLDNGNCDTLNTETETSFNFVANHIGPHVFKFWQGANDNGVDQYLSMEIIVE